MPGVDERAVNDRRFFTILVGALIVLAWLALWVWGQSPYGRFLSHEHLGDVRLEDGALLFVFVAGWVLMTVAMMLPTSMPLVIMFRTLVRQRPDRTRLVLLLITGYLGVWMLFGVGVHLGDWALHQAAERSTWLQANAWVPGAVTLVLAGLYQFSPLKYYCLDKCRSPLSFIVAHWRGHHERAQALWLGVHHGIFCLGCCWTLMLLMFAVGVGSLGWMLVLGTVMAIEKNLPWGRRLSVVVGMLLIAWGLALALGSVLALV
jgi:predicted metal-binding membrane protein